MTPQEILEALKRKKEHNLNEMYALQLKIARLNAEYTKLSNYDEGLQADIARLENNIAGHLPTECPRCSAADPYNRCPDPWHDAAIAREEGQK